MSVDIEGIMDGSEPGPSTQELLEAAEDFPKSGKCLGKAFEIGRGITQDKPTSPIVSNIILDGLVRSVLDVVCSPQHAQHGMVWSTGRRNLVFYDDDGMIAGRDY